jgi:hypothetical protein
LPGLAWTSHDLRSQEKISAVPIGVGQDSQSLERPNGNGAEITDCLDHEWMIRNA